MKKKYVGGQTFRHAFFIRTWLSFSLLSISRSAMEIKNVCCRLHFTGQQSWCCECVVIQGNSPFNWILAHSLSKTLEKVVALKVVALKLLPDSVLKVLLYAAHLNERGEKPVVENEAGNFQESHEEELNRVGLSQHGSHWDECWGCTEIRSHQTDWKGELKNRRTLTNERIPSVFVQFENGLSALYCACKWEACVISYWFTSSCLSWFSHRWIQTRSRSLAWPTALPGQPQAG